MNSIALLVALCAGGFAVAVMMVVVGARGHDPTQTPFTSTTSRIAKMRARGRRRGTVRRAALAFGMGMAVWLLTGWPAAGFIAGTLTVGVPYFFGTARIAKRRIARAEALEEWARRLADSMAVGTTPIQTIVQSADTAPGPVAQEIQTLAAALSTPRLSPSVALRAFADEIDDSVGDMIAHALTVAVGMRSSARVPDVLRMMAVGVSEEVQASRAVETMRSGPRSESKAIVIVMGLFLALVALATDYTAPYGTLLGQLVMAVLGGVILLALWLLRTYTMSRPAPRFFSRAEAR